MLDIGISIGGLLSSIGIVGTLVFGIVAMVRTGRNDSGDERERLARIEANTSETRSDVADIKAELRSVKGDVSDHERRIIQLEASDDALKHRIDEHSDIISEMHDQHIANHGFGGEGTD